MRVLILHNRYRQPGGEGAAAHGEIEVLRANGIDVAVQELDNPGPSECGLGYALKIGVAAAWSKESYQQVFEFCNRYRPDVAHVHNFWMRLSPSVHAACRASGAATVQTLHNFRLLCANALFVRDGRVCEDCLGKVPWRGIARRCYRDSMLASAALTRMIVVNRRRRTWEHDVDAFIALSAHSRSKFIRGQLPAGRIHIKPNFVADPGPMSTLPSASDIVMYVGRLSPEKGVSTLLSAWARGGLSARGRLLIVGDGSERQALENHAARLGLSAPGVIFAGWKSPVDALALLGTARVLVLPSIWYEAFPMTVVEAFSRGRPVLASRLGSLDELVAEGDEGLKFEAGNDTALASVLQELLGQPKLVDRLGERARATYLARYTPERNYEMLMRIYRSAIERRGCPLPRELSAFDPAQLVA